MKSKRVNIKIKYKKTQIINLLKTKMENPKTLLIKNISTLITCDEKDTTYKNAFIYSENGIIKDMIN
jgi:hypothetical protein